MNFVEFDAAVRLFVATASGVDRAKVIPAQDNAPAPDGLYASVKRLEQLNNGIDCQKIRNGDDETVDVILRGNRSILYSVQFYREGSFHAASEMPMFAQSPQGSEALARLGAVWRGASSVRDLTALISNNWEERASIDIRIGTTIKKTQTVNAVTSVDITVSDGAEQDLTNDNEVNTNDS